MIINFTIIVYCYIIKSLYVKDGVNLNFKKFIKSQSPARIIALGFAATIFLGSFILMLPISLNDGVNLKYVDSLYTATSAVCVTGLVTVDPANTFTPFGRCVLAALIQIGGLGVTSFGTGMIIAMGKKLNLKSRNITKEALNLDSRKGIVSFIKEIFLTKYYHNTIVGYSFSKSLSLPGERIGYVAVPDEVADAENVIAGLEVSNRTLGFVNAPSLIQKAVCRCVDEKTDIAFYDKNRKLLYEGLIKLGFTCIYPQGAFYLWMKSPDKDEERFVQAAKKYHIIMVKGAAFACPGYVRLAYCVSPQMIEKSMSGFEELAKEYGLVK